MDGQNVPCFVSNPESARLLGNLVLRRCKDQNSITSLFPKTSIFFSKMQKGIRLNDGHVTYLGLLAKKDGTRRGSLSKKSSDNTKWHTKWFALLQNMLFYFESESSSRPSGLYLLEGCVCDRSPSPKPSLSAKECLEKQVRKTEWQLCTYVCNKGHYNSLLCLSICWVRH